jgi:predicted esterase
MIRLLAILLLSGIPTFTLAAQGALTAGFSEYKVELPDDLRKIAGRGRLSPVTHALVTIAAPANVDAVRDWPVLIVSATSDVGSSSSRRLLREYADTALASGWILLAADPGERLTFEQDDLPMRLALNTAALAVLEKQWPGGAKAPLAFAGFSGGSKHSGWLAAAFASQGRRIIGIYLAGVNVNTLIDAAMAFNVVNAGFKRIPVFIQGGNMDRTATPAQHEDIALDLRKAGFKNVRLQFVPGAHDVDPTPLRGALDWFARTAGLPSDSK